MEEFEGFLIPPEYDQNILTALKNHPLSRYCPEDKEDKDDE